MISHITQLLLTQVFKFYCFCCFLLNISDIIIFVASISRNVASLTHFFKFTIFNAPLQSFLTWEIISTLCHWKNLCAWKNRRKRTWTWRDKNCRRGSERKEWMINHQSNSCQVNLENVLWHVVLQDVQTMNTTSKYRKKAFVNHIIYLRQTVFVAKNLTGDFFYRLLSMKTVKNTTGKQDNGIFWKIIYLCLEIICDNSFSSK